MSRGGQGCKLFAAGWLVFLPSTPALLERSRLVPEVSAANFILLFPTRFRGAWLAARVVRFHVIRMAKRHCIFQGVSVHSPVAYMRHVVCLWVSIEAGIQ